MTTLEQNKALVRRFYAEIDSGNLEAMDKLVAEDYINHDPPRFPGMAPGRVGMKQSFEMSWKGTPGYHVIEDQIAERDLVVTRLRGVGRHEGELGGIPASGSHLEVKAVAIHRIENSRIVEHWWVVDSAVLLSQLGVLELPITSEEKGGRLPANGP